MSRANLSKPRLDECRVAGYERPDVLWSFVDEAKLAEEPDKTAVLELAHEISFQAVDGAV